MVDKDRLTRIEEKLDKLTEKLQDTNIVLAENTKSLIIHEKRTDISENRLSLFEAQLKEYILRDSMILREIEQKLVPITSHVNIVHVVFKYVVPALAGILVFLYKLGLLKY